MGSNQFHSSLKGEGKMKRITTLLTILVMVTLVLTACKSKEAEPGQVEVTRIVKETVVVPGEAAAPAAGKKIVIYMQMGGQQGDSSTLARTNGAKAAAAALGVELIEQYSGWDSQK